MSKRTGPELAPFVYEFARSLHQEAGATKVLLFGSRAGGDWLKESDYDFVVVADRFDGVHFSRRPVDLYQYWHGLPGVEPPCYTQQESDGKRQAIPM